MTAATLVQHKHCPSCGKAILPSRVTCEGACEDALAKVKRNRKWLWRGWMVGTLVLVAIVVSYGPR